MTTIGASLTLIFCCLVLFLPRRFVSLAIVSAVFFITQGQEFQFSGISFTAIRFVEVFTAIRIIVRSEWSSFSWTSPDHWFILLFISNPLIYLLRNSYLDMYTLGLTVDAYLVYFSFRVLIPTPDDYQYFMKRVVLVMVPFAVFMAIEGVTGSNMFSVMGGVPETPIWREGFFRCQGSFRHAITAGTMGATFLPIFIGFLFQRSCRWWALIGTVASLAIVISSHSSGPLMTTVVAIAAWACWKFRDNMKWVRRGLALSLIAMHLVMKAPVWFLFDRISGYIGGDGWHRANLIDKFVENFSKWWLVGMPMEDTKNWAATVTKFGYVDVTNYYISIGISGGLISLIFLVTLQVSIFSFVGSSLFKLRNYYDEKKKLEPMLWGAGSAVCCHVVNLTAVIYFDQSSVIWYLHMAMAVNLAQYFQSETVGLKSNGSTPG